VAVEAISVDACEDSLKLAKSRGYTFDLLSDPQAQVIRQFGVLHPKGGEDGQDIARPAEFLVDAAGTIRWVKLTDDLKVRARPEEVLQAIDRLGR